MSDRDSFAGGFIAGAVLGGLLGGIVGASLSQRQASAARRALRNGISKVKATGRELDERVAANGNSPRRWVTRGPEPTQPVAPEARIEEARRNLENKIAQLNIAIDDARQQLSDAPPATAMAQNAFEEGSAEVGTQSHAASLN
jgi:hypothetical protein